MKFIRAEIPDIILIDPLIHTDERGYFIETYREDKLQKVLGYKINFCQDHESRSHKNVLRGLHFQIPPFEQTKLVRVVQGAALDIAVDIRKNSPTYGKYIKVLLSDKNKKQMFIPKGFAHGFIALEEDTLFTYKVDNIYSPNHDKGIIFNDKSIGVDWGIDLPEINISNKDKNLPTLLELPNYFEYEK
tara:strand:- start:73 stop:636 length:564 start_codon:yes stop_codon:yes gene_type:complete